MSTPTMTRLALEHPSADRWSTPDGRFAIERVAPHRGVPLHYKITDTTRVDWINRPGEGPTIHVFELEDARAMIAKAIRLTRTRRRRT